MYDVYYTTAGGPWFNSGADMWVTEWIKEVAPELDVKPILLFHRRKPDNYQEFKIDIETVWEIDNDAIIRLFEGARRIHILHGHYTPTSAVHQNLEKIDSIVFHNLTKVSLVAQMQKDEYLHWYGNMEYETELMDKIKNKIWVGLYNFPYNAENLYNIPNVYEFKWNKELSESTEIGYAARAEGRKNPEYMGWVGTFQQILKHSINIIKRNMDTDSKKQRFINLITNIKKGSTDLIGEYLILALNMSHSDMEYLKQLIGENFQYYMKDGMFHLIINTKRLTRNHLRKPTKRFVRMIMKPVKQNLKNLKIG